MLFVTSKHGLLLLGWPKQTATVGEDNLQFLMDGEDIEGQGGRGMAFWTQPSALFSAH